MAERTKAKYISSRANLNGAFDADTDSYPPYTFSIRVPNEHYAEARRGWTAADPDDSLPPGRFTPRHVIGVGPNGERGRAVVASINADLWRGHDAAGVRVNTFTMRQADGAVVTLTVTGYVGEQFTV